MTHEYPNGNVVTFVTAMFAGTLGGCAIAHEPPSKMPMSGFDRDAHGCKASAGFAWCANTQRCERPWELGRERGFDNTAEAFGRYCGNAPTHDKAESAARK